MDFSVQIPNLDALLERMATAPSIAAPILQRALSASQAILAKNTNRNTTPWRTGFLVQTFRAEMETGILKWFPTASYAPFVEFGTRSHIIYPKEKRALYWPGAAHPVAFVGHPGTAANPFMERILNTSQDEITSTFQMALAQIIKEITA